MEAISKLWHMVKELRRLDSAAPKLAESIAARSKEIKSATAAAEAHAKKSTEKLVADLSEGLDHVQATQEARVAERMMALKEKLATVKIDTEKVRKEALGTFALRQCHHNVIITRRRGLPPPTCHRCSVAGGLLDKWEDTLRATADVAPAGAKPNPGAAEAARAALEEQYKKS